MSDTPIPVLLVEDSRLDAKRIQQFLDAAESPQFDVVHVTKLKDAIELLKSRTFRIILLDLVLPDSSDLRTVRRTLAHCGETPVVVLTNLDDTWGKSRIRPLLRTSLTWSIQTIGLTSRAACMRSRTTRRCREQRFGSGIVPDRGDGSRAVRLPSR